MPCCAIRTRIFGALLCLLPLAVSAQAADCTLPEFPNPPLLQALQRGVNLTGWDEPDAARHPTLRQLRALRAENFTHVRLPIDHRRLEGQDAASYLSAIYDQAIFLISLDYVVSLDLHAGGDIGPQFADDPEGGFRRLSNVWKRLAPVARSLDPHKVAVELLNEPEMDQAVWMRTADRLIRQLRMDLPEHTIIVGPSGPQRHETLGDMQPFADRNVVYAIHYYDPFAFTHQGLTWGAADDPLRFLKGLPFPATLKTPAVRDEIAELKADGHAESAQLLTRSLGKRPWDAALITEAFDTMAGWAKRNGRPIIVNEFGALTFASPRESRLAWLGLVARSARERCIGWTHWDFQDGFSLMDPQTHLPDAGAIKALNGGVTP